MSVIIALKFVSVHALSYYLHEACSSANQTPLHPLFREQHLPSIQIQLRRNGEGAARLPVPGESESGCAKAPGSLQRTFSKLTSRLGRRALACGGGEYPSTGNHFFYRW